jgi:hypothetical protein
MRVALRRTLRVGANAGLPLEDVGVEPNSEYRMTKRDLLEGNVDLIEHAGSILASRPRYGLAMLPSFGSQNDLSLALLTHNLDRVDVFINERPVGSYDLADGEKRIDVGIVPSDAVIELAGYQAGKLVARRRSGL